MTDVVLSQLNRIEVKLDELAGTVPIVGGPLDGCRITRRPDGIWALPDGYDFEVPPGSVDPAMVWQGDDASPTQSDWANAYRAEERRINAGGDQ